MAVEIGWILNDKDSLEGYNFLIALDQSPNLDLFKLEIIQIIVEYFYQKFKRALIVSRLPKYILYVVIFLANVMVYENMMISMTYKDEDSHEDEHNFRKLTTAPYKSHSEDEHE